VFLRLVFIQRVLSFPLPFFFLYSCTTICSTNDCITPFQRRFLLWAIMCHDCVTCQHQV
jgi:hypothetical protein